MAQKAQKTLATRNTATLNRTHLLSLGINVFYLLLRTFIFTRKLLPYILISTPALLIEFWFERAARPAYTNNGNGQQELKKAGDDLEAKGLTEWMWDVLYWTWGVIVLVAVAGDWAWWLYGVVPLYSAWLAFSTFKGVRSGLMGGAGGAGEDMTSAGAATGQSKRQAKLEKRGGQQVKYR
ncbi:Hypothetical protein R9X50_00604700 [Acrodontium crateriforme]|uniref:DUF788-domain-containing protein n=1 Tax=Acrodontium crateriforme TaxID=150365 RepID=A0AAQ3R6H3_9PEZI|nr:Hypothetical protein R9X50_00604700 [Acrodontium crateriforme]